MIFFCSKRPELILDFTAFS